MRPPRCYLVPIERGKLPHCGPFQFDRLPEAGGLFVIATPPARYLGTAVLLPRQPFARLHCLATQLIAMSFVMFAAFLCLRAVFLDGAYKSRAIAYFAGDNEPAG